MKALVWLVDTFTTPMLLKTVESRKIDPRKQAPAKVGIVKRRIARRDRLKLR
jgi:hypothetical protein